MANFSYIRNEERMTAGSVVRNDHPTGVGQVATPVVYRKLILVDCVTDRLT